MISRTEFSVASSFDRGSFAASSRANSFAKALASAGNKGPAFISQAKLPPAGSAQLAKGEQVADVSGSFAGARGEQVSVEPGTLRVNGAPGGASSRGGSSLKVTDRAEAQRQIAAEYERLRSLLGSASARETASRNASSGTSTEFDRLKNVLNDATARETAARNAGNTAPVDEFTRLKNVLEAASAKEASAKEASAKEAAAKAAEAGYYEAALTDAPEAALRSGSLYSEMAVRQTSDAITEEETPVDDSAVVASAGGSGTSTDEHG